LAELGKNIMGQAVRLSSLDASFLYIETPEMPMHVGSLSIFQLPDGFKGDFFETFKAQIFDRLDLAPMLLKKLAPTLLDLDHPSWIDDEQFDINRHVFRGSLSEPRDMPTLRRIVGWMHAKLLNRARPLWEFYVFENLPDNTVGIYAKLHHALIDGGAGVALSQIVYDLSPNPKPRKKAEAPVEDEPAAKSRKRDVAASVMDTYASLWVRPFNKEAASRAISLKRTGNTDLGSVLLDHLVDQAEVGMKTMAALPTMLKTAGDVLPGMLNLDTIKKLPAMIPPKTPFNKAISSERSFGTSTLSIKRCKAVGKAAGGKMNDVVLALSSGVLRRYLLSIDALPDKPLSAAVPISLREEGNTDTNNQAFAMTCQIATDVADPKVRLETIIAKSTEAKAMISPLKDFVPQFTNASMLGAPMAMQVMSLLYGRSGLSDVLPPTANVIISNVPGPPIPLYVAGMQMLHLWPVSIPTHGMSLNITVQGYQDQLEFGLIAGANIFPDVQGLADMFAAELDELEQAFDLVMAA
jgi:diacylglycerol O-acyltransferase / wax synthase